ncbi:hypothetical protein Rs2_41040 [Raphanus sativus]|nr:hypothetical protein Rs2_41040 [Raphanus sativus]
MWASRKGSAMVELPPLALFWPCDDSPEARGRHSLGLHLSLFRDQTHLSHSSFLFSSVLFQDQSRRLPSSKILLRFSTGSSPVSDRARSRSLDPMSFSSHSPSHAIEVESPRLDEVENISSDDETEEPLPTGPVSRIKDREIKE